jgi:hypothetical protein
MMAQFPNSTFSQMVAICESMILSWLLFGKQIGFIHIEQDIQMSGTIRVILQLSKAVNNVSQSDRTGTACANQLSGFVDDVLHWHSEGSERIMNLKDFEIGVGIAIARDPLLGPGRALISASGSYRG